MFNLPNSFKPNSFLPCADERCFTACRGPVAVNVIGTGLHGDQTPEDVLGLPGPSIALATAFPHLPDTRSSEPLLATFLPQPAAGLLCSLMSTEPFGNMHYASQREVVT